MTESVYKVVELVGTSPESWEKATAAAVALASKSLRDLRIAEVKEMDVQIDNGKVIFAAGSAPHSTPRRCCSPALRTLVSSADFRCRKRADFDPKIAPENRPSGRL